MTEREEAGRSARKHWVLIDTGGKQRYIFGSSRLRHVVGASQLIHEVGTEWVPEAVARLGLPPDIVVMTASGKALLLVDSADDGRAVIREVTRRALRQAPGLQVTGAVGPAFNPSDDAAHEEALRETHKLHGEVRAGRPDPAVRDRVFPWHRLCRDSGLPAETMYVYGDGEPAVPMSAGMLARSEARDRAFERLHRKLGDLLFVVPGHLDVLQHSGWIAVVHADGNGVGGLFRDFVQNVAAAEGVTRQVSLATHRRYQHDVAAQLDDATWEAVREAIGKLVEARRDEDLRGRLLPIVVGGDDVTVACDAALAVDFVRYFADAFARQTAEKPTLAAVAKAATGQAGLTASAGIAVVKPHHPFARSYQLAESLTVSAKQFKYEGRTLAAFDVHVAHASTLRDLELLREYIPVDDKPSPDNGSTPASSAQEKRIARYAGPYLLGSAEELPEALRDRSVARLDEVSGWLGADGWLSGAQAHALRDAADRSLAEYEQQLELLLPRAKDPGRARQLLSVQIDRTNGRTPDQASGEESDQSSGQRPKPFLRLFDALHLQGLRMGTPGRSESHAEAARQGGA